MENDKKKRDKMQLKFIMLEITAALAFIIFIMVIREKPVRPDAKISEFAEAFSEIIEDNGGWSKAGVQELRKYYGISGEEISDFLIYLPASNMDASELLLVIMKDEEQADSIKKAMEKRLEGQKNVFESYGVDQMKLLNGAVLCIKGRYGLFISSERAKDVEKIFKSVIERK